MLLSGVTRGWRTMKDEERRGANYYPPRDSVYSQSEFPVSLSPQMDGICVSNGGPNLLPHLLPSRRQSVRFGPRAQEDQEECLSGILSITFGVCLNQCITTQWQRSPFVVCGGGVE